MVLRVWVYFPDSRVLVALTVFFLFFFFKEFGNLADGLDLWKRLAACKQTLLFSVGGHTCFAGVSGVLRGLRTAFVLCDTQLEGCCYLRLCCVPLML